MQWYVHLHGLFKLFKKHIKKPTDLKYGNAMDKTDLDTVAIGKNETLIKDAIAMMQPKTGICKSVCVSAAAKWAGRKEDEWHLAGEADDWSSALE